jgi:hypothetical protein
MIGQQAVPQGVFGADIYKQSLLHTSFAAFLTNLEQYLQLGK